MAGPLLGTSNPFAGFRGASRYGILGNPRSTAAATVAQRPLAAPKPPGVPKPPSTARAPGAPGQPAQPTIPPVASPLDASYFGNVAANQFKTNNQINSLNLNSALASQAMQAALAQLAYQQPKDELKLEQNANRGGGLY